MPRAGLFTVLRALLNHLGISHVPKPCFRFLQSKHGQELLSFGNDMKHGTNAQNHKRKASEERTFFVLFLISVSGGILTKNVLIGDR